MGQKAVDFLAAQIAGEKVPLHTNVEFELVTSAQAPRIPEVQKV